MYKLNLFDTMHYNAHICPPKFYILINLTKTEAEIVLGLWKLFLGEGNFNFETQITDLISLKFLIMFFFVEFVYLVAVGSYLTKVVLIDNFHLPEKAVGDLSGKKVADNCRQKLQSCGHLQGTGFWLDEYLAFHRCL